MTTVQSQQVKSQGHVAYQQEQRYYLATNNRINFKLGEYYQCGALSRLVGQINRK